NVFTARQDPGTASGPRGIEGVASQFAFDPATIEVTEGERVRLMGQSAGRGHGFQIKKLRINKPIPRGGKPVQIDFVAPAPGTYEIMCSEDCGEGREDMTCPPVGEAM